LIRPNEAFEIDGSDVIELLSGIESRELLNNDLKEIKQIGSHRFSLLFNSLPFRGNRWRSSEYRAEDDQVDCFFDKSRAREIARTISNSEFVF
jgi:hypothetical protein